MMKETTFKGKAFDIEKFSNMNNCSTQEKTNIDDDTI
jgi:hypothetical protein